MIPQFVFGPPEVDQKRLVPQMSLAKRRGTPVVG